MSSEYHLPYFDAYQALLGEPARSRVSFIVHHSVMNRQTLADLKALIERRRERPWWQAILDVCGLLPAVLLRGRRAVRELQAEPQPVDRPQVVGELPPSKGSNVVPR